MSDDGTGNGIRIPSMLISKSDGEKLINWLEYANKTDYSALVVMATFEMDKNENNDVKIDFWMTSSSNRALDFLEDFG